MWYEGDFEYDKPHGYGKMYHPSGMLRYEGQLEDVQFVGWGKEYYENGNLKFEGVMEKSMYFFYGARRYRVGKLYYEDGRLRYEGTFTGLKSYEFDRGIEYKADGEVGLSWGVLVSVLLVESVKCRLLLIQLIVYRNG
ncbi:toxin-antitoxin system YwqK family antitoxin [Salinibacillus xinjiangensis]|uniref:Uncharacterized protein n=1 Tax=Salinibacillus xinjiangensis TaxID=1229268 RepID=A0A6G1XB58_9BACI|nr:hypothetical protein [Salinibacillus xinjiangensis]MRG88145.1 hypothetical protein [Salinibacillus xinjiangensis]